MINHECAEFRRTSAIGLASELTYIGSDSTATNTEAAEIVLTPDPNLPTSPTSCARDGGFTKICFDVTTQDSPLADFALIGRATRRSPSVTLISGSTWGTVAGILKHKVGSINTLAADSTAFAQVEIGPMYSIGFEQKSGASEVLTNGTFTGNANNWTIDGSDLAYGTNNVAWSNTSDAVLSQAKADMVSSGAGWIAGALYEVQFTISGYTAGNITIGTTANSDQYVDSDGNSIQVGDDTYSAIITSDGADEGLLITGVGFTGVIDDVSVKRLSYAAVNVSAYR